MSVGERIKNKRIELGLSQEELAHKMGYKGRSAVSMIESSNELSMSKVKKAAIALDVRPGYLMGWEDSTVSSELNRPTRTVKIYGRIAGGAPIEMIENVIDEVDLATLPEKYDGRSFDFIRASAFSCIYGLFF